MDFDRVITPAFSIASTPGAYAMLLGAGISRSSGVPSAWEIQADLIRRVAALQHEEVGEDEVEAWWRTWAKSEPGYSSILERVAPAPHERQALLRNLFEPDEAERAEGRKLPSAAHRAIAQLVSTGHVRVIVTTNFDLLLERAIRDIGIEPYVVSDSAGARGLPPIHTLPALIVHLHGDYLNPSTMLNTSTELEAYDADVLQLLEGILQTHGLIIAGWSATWDSALRAAVEGESRRFYSPLWIDPFELSPIAERLVTALGADLLVAEADVALPALAEAVASTVNIRARHPLLPGAIVETTKRALAGKSALIDLHDLVRSEFERLRTIPELDLSERERTESLGDAEARVAEAALVPAALVATTAYWGNDQTDRWWFDELERFSRQARGGGLTRLLTIRRVAGERLFYAAGVAAVLSSRYELIARLAGAQATSNDGKQMRLADVLHARSSAELFEQLRPVFSTHLGVGDERYQEGWERFEYLLMVSDLISRTNMSRYVADQQVFDLNGNESRVALQDRLAALRELGSRIDARGRHLRAQDHMPSWHTLTGLQFLADIENEQDAHPLVAAGLGGWRELRLAAEATELAVGEVAERVSWSKMPPGGGTVPSFVWTDDSN